MSANLVKLQSQGNCVVSSVIFSRKVAKMVDDVVRGLVIKTCELPVDPNTLAEDADLYAAGLTSFASVQLMLALEEEFDIEFPDHLLNRKTFSTLRSIADAVAALRSEREAA